MHALVRSLLVWLMVLAVQSQGFAASFMPHCTPVGSAAPMLAIAAVSTDRHLHVHVEKHAEVPAERGPELVEADSLNPMQGKGTAGAGSCSVCAACCSAIGMPPTLCALQPSPSATRTLQMPVMDHESFLPGGLDRPPRTNLA